MEREHENRIGEELGSEGVERLVEQVENICLHESTRIRLANEPEILRLQLELGAWADEEKRIGERLRLAPPPGDRRSRRRSAWCSFAVALVLTASGFAFSLLAFEPFRLGWKSYLYCLGIALACPYGIEKCLKEWDCRHVIRALATFAGIAAITSLVLLAVIRGRLFMQELKAAESQVVVTDDHAPPPQDDNHFYQETLPLLQLVMAFLALAMELEAGLALHDAKILFETGSGEDAESIAKELMAVRGHMAALAGEIVERSHAAASFEACFWRDFYTAVLRHATRKALGKLLCLALFLGLGGRALRADEQRLNLVILLDLSGSVASKGPDGKTDFEKNVAAVTDLLGHVPAGTHVTVVGITGNSFAEPDILLQAEIPADRGYFGERLTAAHRQTVQVWQSRAAHLAPNAKRTDILGALLVASQIFEQQSDASRKILVIYSDMRQATPDLDLERRDQHSANEAVIKDSRKLPLPDFKGVEVYCLGVDAAGRNASDWKQLSRFWEDYFTSAGTRPQSYSILRGLPRL